ncbi:Six-hairpin glycosidase-like protein [Thelonectria olida]|uniref:Six-hairpin glycosidase-like protein n=1 Tax=Thelonectria olida TaxID=1576542 RepID=A0A9P9ASZ5_9HYPO|nr:Six-hairpin glycosidase-like protein [Thelonectria olida]
MKSPSLLAVLAASASAASAANTSYARRMADSVIRRGVDPSFHYSQATLYTGLENVYALTGNSSIYDFYREQIDALVAENGSIALYNYSKHSLDNYRLGNNILWWYEKTGEEKFKIAAEDIKATLDSHPRTPTGGLWHRDPTYPNQMWLDGIFMADTFYAKYVSLFQPNNETAWADIALQYDKIDNVTRKDNNLLVHGYDEGKTAVWADPETGAAPLVWARADGWYFMALLEVINLFPKKYAARERLITYFQLQAEGLKNAQDELGGWWNIMDSQYEDVEGNYLESSASAMFAVGWIRGLNRGLLNKKTYAGVAKKAYNALVDLWITENDDGTINWEGTVEVGSLGSNATFQYYASIDVVQNDLRGIGSFLVAAKEWESRKF